MELIQINKSRYRKHLNVVIVCCIIALTSGSLGIAQTLIAVFPDPDGSHFHWNLLGVIVTALIIGGILGNIKQYPFMTEVVYVWDLKQVLNKLTRKMATLKRAAQDGDIDAMNAIQYSYAGSRLLWQLDDNTLVMDELSIAQAELDALAKHHNVTLDASSFQISHLKQY